MDAQRSYWTAGRRRLAASSLLAVAVLLIGLAFVLPSQPARGRVNEPQAPAAPADTPAPSTTGGTPKAWTATRIPDLPKPLEANGVAALDGQVWSVGGMAPEEPERPAMADVFVYDPRVGRWAQGPPLPAPTSHIALVSDGEQLLAIGGWDTRRRSLTTVLRLDADAGRWVEATPLPVAGAAGAAAWDGRRVVYGGGMARGGAASDEVWALKGDRWEFIGQLQKPRHHLAAASDGRGRVWFMGGRDDRLRPSQLGAVDEVTSSGVFPVVTEVTPNQGAAAVWWPGVGPCLIGGHGLPDGPRGRPAYIGAVECPNGDHGVRLPALTEPRAGMAAALLGDEIYVIGGHGNGFTGSGISDVLRPAAS
jgi:hypothetical protein